MSTRFSEKIEKEKLKPEEETSVKRGRPADENKRNKKMVSLKLDIETIDESKKMAEQLDRNFSNYVNHALKKMNEQYALELELQKRQREKDLQQ